jgi:hypothetical protein
MYAEEIANKAKQMFFFALAAAVGLTAACDKKGSGSSSSDEKGGEKMAKLEMTRTKIPALGISMMAPKSAEIQGDKSVTVSKGDVFGMSITKDIYGAKGDDLIIPFEKKRLKKKLVDEPTLQIWEKEMGGETVVLFAMTVEAGDKKLYIQSSPTGMFNRKQVDRMVEAARTIKK